MTPHEFNSYGARRGNDAVMARGTFANIRLVNKLVDKAGPKTRHFPSGDVVSVVLLEHLVCDLVGVGEACLVGKVVMDGVDCVHKVMG